MLAPKIKTIEENREGNDANKAKLREEKLEKTVVEIGLFWFR